MNKRIVLALGGNALGDNPAAQKAAVKVAAKAIADLVQDGNQVVITHGNGPQVGMIKLAMETANKHNGSLPEMPMYDCVAMSQGYIGVDIQNELREELIRRGIPKPVVTVVTQIVVDEKDPAFSDPTKPIGAFYSEEEAREMIARGYEFKEDSGRGWRRVIASPKPIETIEAETVRILLEAGQIPIAAGGGGVPVIKGEGDSLVSVNAIIDKDFASAKLAEELGADMLVILTAVEKVALNYRKPDERLLSEMSVEAAERYTLEGHFAPGSMLPKVEASVGFVKTGHGRSALITLLAKAKEALEGKTGTVIHK